MFSNIAEMMKQLQSMKENMEKAKEELKREKIVVEVGGGMVKVTVNGVGEIIDIDIDKSVIDDYELLRELLISGVNEAIERSRDVMTQKMTEAAGIPLSMLKMGGLF
ncbi:MAG: YbaB/EbfC family nucleoid-associated protein [Hydrogenothermaceae bacterium]|nr:YbaB/EbfC family nucleoid-associated protein [Hydrogenothermaceae bacterium]